MTRSLVIVGLLLATATPAVGATHWCGGNGTVIDVSGAAYVAVDAILDGTYIFSIWVYAETNGEPGLQRGGTTPLGRISPYGAPDVCQESDNPDMALLF